MKTLITSDRTALGRDEPELVDLPDGFSTGRHEKASVQCPCGRLAALHAALWTQLV